jgi:glutamate/tyrosine decarboxylase-like PLP-dependent enzyme
MPGKEPGEPRIMPARAQRKRTWLAELIGKTEDIQACLRGAVSRWCRKRKKIPNIRGDLDACFFGYSTHYTHWKCAKKTAALLVGMRRSL